MLLIYVQSYTKKIHLLYKKWLSREIISFEVKDILCVNV